MSNLSKKIKKSSKNTSFSRSKASNFFSTEFDDILQPFLNYQLLPQILKNSLRAGPNIDFDDVYKLKTPINYPKFNKKLEKMKFLGQAQDSLLEKWLQEKCKLNKNSSDLQQFFCYENAKTHLKTLFDEFFAMHGIGWSRNQLEKNSLLMELPKYEEKRFDDVFMPAKKNSKSRDLLSDTLSETVHTDDEDLSLGHHGNRNEIFSVEDAFLNI